MIELLSGTGAGALVLAAIGGFLLGVVFFGGLAWTVERVLTSDRPAALVISSYLARIVIVAAGVALVMQGSWERALACLAGLIGARSVIRWRVEHGGPEGGSDAAHS